MRRSGRLLPRGREFPWSMSDKRATVTTDIFSIEVLVNSSLLYNRVGRTGLQPQSKDDSLLRGKSAPSDFELLQNPFFIAVL